MHKSYHFEKKPIDLISFQFRSCSGSLSTHNFTYSNLQAYLKHPMLLFALELQLSQGFVLQFSFQHTTGSITRLMFIMFIFSLQNYDKLYNWFYFLGMWKWELCGRHPRCDWQLLTRAPPPVYHL